MVFRIVYLSRLLPQQQEQHLLHQQLEVLLSYRCVLYYRIHIFNVGVTYLGHQLLYYFLNLRQDFVVVVLEHKFHPFQS